MKNILLTLFAILALLGVGILYVYIQENPKNSFKSYDALLASGLIEKGWVPSYIPSSATNIEEHHNIDSNEVRMSFNYNKNESTTLNVICKLLVENKKGKKYVCPPFIDRTSVIVLRNDGLGYFRSTDDGLRY